jgi:hypothetical protein
VTFFFDAVYAMAIFLALWLAGLPPGLLVGLVWRRADRIALVPAAALAVAGWVWAGWLGTRYGISRLGLVLFAAVGAAGFVAGWLAGLRAAARVRARRSRTPAFRR